MDNKIYQQVTDRIVAELEKGCAPWIKPWRADATADKNVITQKPYRGINRLILGMMNRTNPAWATYKQWQALGGQVIKGETGTHIVYFQPVVNTKGADNEPGKSYALLKTYCVFNVEQVSGIEITSAPVPTGEFNPIEKAEQTIVATGANISHGGDAAFYSPSADRIQLPHKVSFDTAEHYYATAFHELTHWTAHKSRLERDLSGRFGNPEYAFEELVAEMGAAYLCADHQLEGRLQHADYIANWLKACRADNKIVFKAAALAQKATDFISRTAEPVAIAA